MKAAVNASNSVDGFASGTFTLPTLAQGFVPADYTLTVVATDTVGNNTASSSIANPDLRDRVVLKETVPSGTQ